MNMPHKTNELAALRALLMQKRDEVTVVAQIAKAAVKMHMCKGAHGVACTEQISVELVRCAKCAVEANKKTCCDCSKLFAPERPTFKWCPTCENTRREARVAEAAKEAAEAAEIKAIKAEINRLEYLKKHGVLCSNEGCDQLHLRSSNFKGERSYCQGCIDAYKARCAERDERRAADAARKAVQTVSKPSPLGPKTAEGKAAKKAANERRKKQQEDRIAMLPMLPAVGKRGETPLNAHGSKKKGKK
jgi:hypothetical protein